jgi:uridine kinase
VARSARERLLERIADDALALGRTTPTLIGIEGRSAAGKTTFADELGATLSARGRATIRSSIDDFHTPGHKHRSIRREYTPESYIAMGYDYAGFRRSMLDPLADGGDRRCKSALWNSGADEPIDDPFVQQPENVIAVVDGVLLFHPLLEHAWHFTIWLDIDWDTMLARALERDIAWVKSAHEVRWKYRNVWQPLHELYERTMRPRERCDVVIDNRDVNAPVLVR